MKMKYSRPSTNRRKTREFSYHQRKRAFSVHLSRELREKYQTRSLPVRKGDTVIVMKGKYSGFTKKVSKVNLKNRKVQIEGVKTTKTDGTEIFHNIEPSNLILLTLGTVDDTRKKLIDRKSSIEEEDAEDKED